MFIYFFISLFFIRSTSPALLIFILIFVLIFSQRKIASSRFRPFLLAAGCWLMVVTPQNPNAFRFIWLGLSHVGR